MGVHDGDDSWEVTFLSMLVRFWQVLAGAALRKAEDLGGCKCGTGACVEGMAGGGEGAGAG